MKVRAQRAAVVALAAGGAVAGVTRADFTFAPYCNNNWYQDCAPGPQCSGGGWVHYNNWGYTGCSSGLPTPGTADVVHLGGASVVVNGNVNVGALDMTSAAVMDIHSGDFRVVQPVTNTGTMRMVGANLTWSGTYNNQGTIVDISGYGRSLEAFTLNNSGTLEFQNSYWAPGAGGALVTNTGLLKKTTGSNAQLFMNLNQQGAVQVEGGGLFLRNNTVTSTPAAAYSVGAGTLLQFENMAVSGQFNGTNAGAVRMHGAIAVSGNTAFNITGNPLEWHMGSINTGPSTFTNQGLLVLNGANLTLNGTFVNSGTWMDTSGYGRAFQNATFTNHGTLEFRNTYWAPEGGALLTNNGTILKTTGSNAQMFLPTVNNGGVSVQEGWAYWRNTTLNSTPASSWTIGAAGLELGNMTLSGRFGVSNNGTFRGSGPLALSADTTINSAPNAFEWHGNDLNTGPYTLTNQGRMVLNGANTDLRGTIVNTGTLSDTSGYGRTFVNATLTNSGVLEWHNTYWVGSGSQVVNNGVLRKLTGANAQIFLPFVNNASVDLQQGNTYFRGLVTSSPAGSWTVGSAGLLFENATLRGQYTGVNSGSVWVTGGLSLADDTTLTFGGNPVQVQAGAINTGPHTLTNAGQMVWNGANLTLTGTLHNTGTLVEQSGYGRMFENFTFTNSGTVEFQNTYWAAGSGAKVFNNTATARKTTGGNAQFFFPIENSGGFELLGGWTYFHGGLLQTAGVTQLSGGGIGGGSVTLAGGRLEGAGSVQAVVTNNAGVLGAGVGSGPGGAGEITIHSNYTQTSGGTFEVDLAGPVQTTQYDHVRVTGNASIAGKLRVKWSSAAPLGTTYRVLDVNGTLTGEFGQIEEPDAPYSSTVAASYDAHGVTLTVVQRCGSSDYNADGDYGTDQDIEAFFACLGGTCCEGCHSDFNYDGDIGTDQDIEAFFRVLGGGGC
ncbi:MAG TPA: hypothetical protein VD997_09280 [Phycisphaerales bacterium]|nr:hypothetical protein [Phycisphaerales bacterium]